MGLWYIPAYQYKYTVLVPSTSAQMLHFLTTNISVFGPVVHPRVPVPNWDGCGRSLLPQLQVFSSSSNQRWNTSTSGGQQYICRPCSSVLQKCAFVSAVKSRADGKSEICNEQFKIFGWETRQSGRMQNISQKGHLSRNSHQSRHVAVANYVFLLVNVQTKVK